MFVPLLVTESLLSHVKHARHHARQPDRQICGRLGGQTRSASRPRSLGINRGLGSGLTRPMPPAPLKPAPQLFVLILPNRLLPPLRLPHPLMPLTTTLKLALQPPEKQEEEDLADAINSERLKHGLGSLTVDPLLCEAARAHSREMCDLRYFNHASPTDGEQTPMDRYLNARRDTGAGRPRKAVVGENIFYASQTSDVYNIDYAHQSLMASPEHRENILAPHFTKVGIGLCRDAHGRFWVTEMFLQDD